MRVYDLAKQRGLQSKDVMDVCHLLNIEVKTPSSSIDDKSVRRILEELSSKKKPAQPAKTEAPAKPAEPKKPAAAPRPPVAPRAAAPQPAPVKEPEVHKDARALALERIARAKAARRQQHEENPTEVVAVEAKSETTAPQHQEFVIATKAAPIVAKPVEPPKSVIAPTPAVAVAPVPKPQAPARPPQAILQQQATPTSFAPRVERPTGTGVVPRVERPAGTSYPPRSDRPAPRSDGQRPYPSRDGGGGGRDGQRPSYPPRDGQRPAYPSRDGQRPSYPSRDGQQRPPYAGRPSSDRPGGGAPRPAGGGPRPAGGQRLDTRRSIELAELPSLKKAGMSRKKVELKTAPSIEVMKLRPTRRLAGGKKVETEEEKTARRVKAAKATKGAGAVEKRIRPGLFLNLETLEENVVKTDDKGRPRPRTDALKNQGRRGQQQRAPVAPPEPKIVKIQGDLTVAEFAQKTGLGIAEIITKGMVMGEMLTVNKLMSADLCELIATECKIMVELVPEGDEYDVEEFIEKDAVDAPENMKPRPPVVTIMGHVDHGKTTLLDTIRKTNVAGGEFGGITQHIGAYRVATSRGEVVFLDTPGHEAFTAMRARGASCTDIVILVVAADDSLMPQTIEAINHARAAKVPLIVAINKIDIPGAQIQKVRQDLMQYSLFGEELGGDTIICEVSAKKGTGIDNLLEMVLLQAEIMELKANPDARATGVVIDSKIDPLRGISATVLVQNGTLRQGDAFVCGDVSGRVRHLRDDHGTEVEAALPAYPVELIGLDGCPQVGEKFLVMENERQARQIAAVRETRRRRKSQNAALKPHVTLEGLSDYLSQDNKPKDLNIVLKADVQGSAEAVSQALDRLSTEKVSIRILHSGVGAITESDVQLAMASDAIIIGFNVRSDSGAGDLARAEGIDIKTYRVIYELLEEMQKAMLGMLDKKFKEVPRGAAQIRQVFKVSRQGNIAGCYVTTGVISRSEKMRLIRDGSIVHTGEILSLRRVKDDVATVQSGYECGITLKDFQDIREGDVIETFAFEEVAQTL